MRRWLLLASVALSASAFTVHQHSQKEECLELQCPATAFEYGIRNLVSEETLRSDRCQSCQQCTASGYSICLKMSDSRGRRGSQTEGCSCTHSIPANCHSEPSRQPPNMTMTAFHICYLSALQAPPRPLAVNNKDAVIVTVEPFWTEPYWRDLQMENLTLHYEFAVQKPEHCEGELVTTEGDRVEHYCKDSVKLEMEGPLDSEGKNDDEEYEHSDDYKEYDDSLPPEVAFDRDVFDGAKLLKAYYSVQVRRPRQLAVGSSDPFRDQTTMLDSEMLKFDLKPEIYGTGIPELPPAAPSPTEKEDDILPATDAPTEDDEDVSEEHGEGTNFFEDDVKEQENDTKSEEEQEKEDAELEKKISEMEATSTEKAVEARTTEKEEIVKESEEEETKKEEKVEEEEEKKEERGQKEEIDESPQDDKTETEKADSEEKKEENDEEEETTTMGEDEDAVTEEDEIEKDDKSEETKDSEEEETDEQTPSSTEKTITLFGHKFTKWPLARLVFFVCLCSFLLILSLWCCRKCCCKSEEKTTANGYRYSNPNASGRNDLVCPPEKERLHQ